MNQIDQGRAHLANGDVKEAIVAFWAATQEEEGPEPWHALGLSLSLAGRWEDLLRVVNIANPAVPFFHNICIDLMERGEYRALGEMHLHIPETHIISPVAIYFAGVSLIADKRPVESLEHFHQFKLRVLNNLDHFRPLLQDANFHVMFRQGTLVEPLSFVAGLDQGAFAIEERDPALEFEQKCAADGSSALFACCLNDLYFLKFADTLVSSLLKACGPVSLHFHLIGDRKECLDRFRALEAQYPDVSLGLSLEREPLARHAIYYACNRFIVVPQLIAAYDHDLMMLDADAIVQQDLGVLRQRLAGDPAAGQGAADFACFETGRTEPASVNQATLTYFANSPGSQAFIRLLRLYVFAKLDQPPELTWMLDQAALFSVALYLEDKAEQAFAFQRLDQLTGCDLADYVLSAGTQDEKRALKQAGSPL